MAKKRSSGRHSQESSRQRPARQLAPVLPPPDPNICPICQERFTVIVGCHKICRCGYEEGCGD